MKFHSGLHMQENCHALKALRYNFNQNVCWIIFAIGSMSKISGIQVVLAKTVSIISES